MSGFNNSKMRMLWGILLVSLVSGWSFNAYADGGDLAWAKHAGGMRYEEFGFGIATYPDGTCVITGEFGGRVVFGEGEENETILRTEDWDFYYDPFVAKYNADGTLVWAKGCRGLHWDSGRDIASFPDGTCVVTGYFRWDTLFGEGEENETWLLTQGDYDVFVAKYNADGTLAWAKHAGGTELNQPDRCYGYGIASYSDGTCVITGCFQESATFGAGEGNATTLSTAGSYDIFVAKYNADGTLAWAKRAGGGDSENGYKIASFPDGTCVVSGYFEGTAIFGEGEGRETALTSLGSYDAFVTKYNADGTLAWAKRAGGANEINGYGIASYSDGTCVVTGFFEGAATFGEGEGNETTLISAGWWDIFVAKYNNDGTLAWVRSDGSEDWDSGYGITSYSDGTFAVTGFFEGTAIFGADEGNETTLASTGSDDIFIAKYNADGTHAWAKGAGGGRLDMGLAIASYTDGTSVATGCITESSSPAVFGKGEENETTLISIRGKDIFVAKYYDFVDADRPIPEELIEDPPDERYFEDSALLIWDYTGTYSGGSPGFVNLGLFKDELEQSGIFNANRKAIIIVHGWNSSTEADWVTEMATAIIQGASYGINVFAWDWEENAYRPLPEAIVKGPPTENVDNESHNLATALEDPLLANIRNASSIYFIGHSLGAAVSIQVAEMFEEPNNNIDVKKVTLLDAPENWLPQSYNNAVELYDEIEVLSSQYGVLVDNYPSEFGVNYEYATNYWLRDAADQPGTPWLLGWFEDHWMAHAWYTNTINPNTTTMPTSSEGQSLLDYFTHLTTPEIFWTSVDDVGYGLQDSDFDSGHVWLPENYFPAPMMSSPGLYAFKFNKTEVLVADPTYNMITTDDFSNIGDWHVDGTSYLQNNEIHILTNSPTYLFETITVAENIDVLRFQYRFEGGHEGDMLLLYADETMLWAVEATTFNEGAMRDSGWINIQRFSGETIRLCFVLVNGTEEQAHAVIDNLELTDKIGPENTVPIADAGPNQTVYVDTSCEVEVTLDGSDSNDIDGDELSYRWILDDEIIAIGQNPTTLLPLGTHSITLIVRDFLSDSEPDEIVITVVDETAPELSVSVEPAVLWPPNHKMVQVSSVVSASDSCGDPVSITLLSITVNEGEETDTYDPGYDDTQGDGNTTDDIQVDSDGNIYLRAERSGKSNGRVYTISYQAEDTSGNTTQATATVTVPHSQP